MESVLARVAVMVLVGTIGGAVAILLVRAETRRRDSDATTSNTADGDFVESPPQNEEDFSFIATNSVTHRRYQGERDPRPEASSSRMQEEHWWRRLFPNVSTSPEDSALMMPQLSGEVKDDDGRLLGELIMSLRRKLLSVTDDGDKNTNRDQETKTNRHRIRHSGRKAHHRMYDEAFSKSRTIANTFPLLPKEKGASGNDVSNAENAIHTSREFPPGVRDNASSNYSQKNLVSASNKSHDLTHHTPKHTGVGGEVREALLLAVPLSLLLTLLLLLCVACCCCRYRYHLAYIHHHYRLSEDCQQNNGDDCPSLGISICEACLPDLYQFHQDTGTSKSLLIPSSTRNQLDYLEADQEVPGLLDTEEEAKSGSLEESKSDLPLYMLLSNLPPGSSLQDDEDVSLPLTFSKAKRSQSLECLVV